MGLLDKLLKEGAEALKEIATEENKEKAAALFNSLKDTINEHADELKKAVDEFQTEAQKKEAEETKKDEYLKETEDGLTSRQRILNVLANEFPQYKVRENVSPKELGGEGRFMDYSIVICDGESPKLILMLIGKTTTAHREYRWSREEAEKRGIPFLNFVEHYPNTTEYISDRLHKYL
ncbi:MAG: hypothetical protein IKF46_00305 [Erysipelotrichaceae bacterium]|nr:hypothetical protein [Erysipelotrichaceae bacterium]